MTFSIKTEAGGAYLDADEEVLRRVIEQMTPANTYLIVERDDRPDAYAQTALQRRPDSTIVDGRYVVEYRDGPNSHWQAPTDDRDVVHSVLAGWAYDREDWKSLVDWKVLDLGF